jgi:hypothetical protein
MDSGGPATGKGSSAAGPVPARVRVTAPRPHAPLPGGAYPVSRELAEQSEVGEVFVRSLIRSQLRLAVVVALGFLVLLLGTPLLLGAFPVLSAVTVFTVPLPWLVMGVGVYPLVLACAGLYTRSAARNEADYLRLIRR